MAIVAAERSKRRPAFSLWPVRPEALRSALRAGFLTRLWCSLGPQQYIRRMAYKGSVQTPIASLRLGKPAGEFAVWAATSGPNQYGPSARGRAEAVWGCATRGRRHGLTIRHADSRSQPAIFLSKIAGVIGGCCPVSTRHNSSSETPSGVLRQAGFCVSGLF
jgi:hypothetical protein